MYIEDTLKLAVKLADENWQTGHGDRYGAVLVKNGSIIATGTNEVNWKCDPTAHAEIQAIRTACLAMNVTELIDCELYASDEPCPMCMSAIRWSGIKRVYYARASETSFQDNWSEGAAITSLHLME
ncbi:nucleoside deaminase [Paenibacillus sp. CF384]|uniref:nucleoside deaminase n=1 Tax=Paenibacillus sp. CF384 TaxID=1884382 RepID=UPI0008986D1E|nr:nucleoside deaminase [Paenibacillus sp. CF384]SDX50674.1 Cytidine and deoxycytidylate deaminase zinc-binding region [Paenibacillus sp. CF384]